MEEPVQLVQFWSDHFFGDLINFIIDIKNGMHTYYNRTTSEVLPTPLDRMTAYNNLLMASILNLKTFLEPSPKVLQTKCVNLLLVQELTEKLIVCDHRSSKE